mmetsp:Transcript_133783/g.416108  ORF Transcript_133783/g.416108 Transcript_133783/m.416108 type:complete len:112 (+) Transcript_133783:610-945(+)
MAPKTMSSQARNAAAGVGRFSQTRPGVTSTSVYPTMMTTHSNANRFALSIDVCSLDRKFCASASGTSGLLSTMAAGRGNMRIRLQVTAHKMDPSLGKTPASDRAQDGSKFG